MKAGKAANLSTAPTCEDNLKWTKRFATVQWRTCSFVLQELFMLCVYTSSKAIQNTPAYFDLAGPTSQEVILGGKRSK